MSGDGIEYPGILVFNGVVGKGDSLFLYQGYLVKERYYLLAYIPKKSSYFFYIISEISEKP